jgi:anthranilate synthase component 2
LRRRVSGWFRRPARRNRGGPVSASGLPLVAATPRLLMIDNVDSFTFMLVDTLRVAGAKVRIVRSDAITVEHALSPEFDGIMISPGPGRPEDAGASVAIAAACIEARRPLLGVCLGHQAIAIACGGTVGRVTPVHGKALPVRHDGSGLFAGLPSPFAATRYHSLAVGKMPAPLVANAWSDDGTVMALRHTFAPVHGLQFHPESIASERGTDLIRAFVDMVRIGA